MRKAEEGPRREGHQVLGIQTGPGNRARSGASTDGPGGTRRRALIPDGNGIKVVLREQRQVAFQRSFK